MATSTPGTFFAIDGTQLSGVVTRFDTSGTAKSPAVLLCQGLSGVKDLVLPTVAAQFAEAGITTLRFDYRGYGESEGAQGWVDPQGRIADALAAFAFLAQLPDVNTTQLGVYGLSYGGPIALSVAARDARVRAMVSVSGPGAGDKLLHANRDAAAWSTFLKKIQDDRRLRATTGHSKRVSITDIIQFSPTFLRNYNKLKSGEQSSAMDSQEAKAEDQFWFTSADLMMQWHPELEAQLIKSCPTLFINGEMDDIATLEQVKEAFTNVSSLIKKLEIVPGYDHIGMDAGPGLLHQIELAIKWFIQHFQKEPS